MPNPYISGEEFANNPRYTAEWFLRKVKVERDYTRRKAVFESFDNMYDFLAWAESLGGIVWGNNANPLGYIPPWSDGDLYISYDAGRLLRGRIISLSLFDRGRLNIITPGKESRDEFDIASDAEFCSLLT